MAALLSADILTDHFIIVSLLLLRTKVLHFPFFLPSFLLNNRLGN